MNKEEAENKIQDFLTVISNHGYHIKTTIINNLQIYNFWVGNIVLGRVYVTTYGNEDKKTYDIQAWTETRVIMTDQVSFLKNRVSHDVQIKVNNTKWFRISDPNEFKKFLEWETIMTKHLKTAFAKKRRMELDVDFE